MSTAILPVSSTAWSSFEHLAKIDKHYELVAAYNPDEQRDEDCYVCVDLWRIDPSVSKLEKTYQYHCSRRESGPVVALETIDALKVNPSVFQI